MYVSVYRLSARCWSGWRIHYHQRSSLVRCTESPAVVVRSTLERPDKDWKPESRNTEMPATGEWRRDQQWQSMRGKANTALTGRGHQWLTGQEDPESWCWRWLYKFSWAFQQRWRTGAAKMLDHGSEDTGGGAGYLSPASSLQLHVSLVCMAITTGHFCTSLTFALRTTRASSRNVSKASDSSWLSRSFFL